MFEKEENLLKEDLSEEKDIKRDIKVEIKKETKKKKAEGKAIEVHTMPEKFLRPGKTEKKLVLPIFLGIIIIILVSGGIYLFQKELKKKKGLKLVNLELPIPQKSSETEINKNQNTNIPFISSAKTVRSQIFNEERELISSARLFFPQGCLKSDFPITLSSRLPKEETDPRFTAIGGIYTFTPEKINLLKATTLIFVYKEGLVKTDLEKDLKIAVLEDGLWEEVSSEVDVEKNMISVALDKFSSNSYGLVISKDFFTEEPSLIPPTSLKDQFIDIAAPSSSDLDKDGLTDEEERIYQTDINNPDTDQDSYPDGLEIINLYSTLAGPGVRLSVSGLINSYTNPVYNYIVFYPASFLAKALEGTDNREVMFTSHTGEFIEIIVQDNPRRLTVIDWYLEQSSGVDPSQLRKVNVNGKEAVWSTDGQTIYIADGDKIYVITYNFGARTNVNFKSTFEMMIKSFKILEEPISYREEERKISIL